MAKGSLQRWLRLRPARTQRATQSRTTGIVTLNTGIISLNTGIITLNTGIITQTRDTIRVSGSADLLSGATANLRVSDKTDMLNMTVKWRQARNENTLRALCAFA